MSSAQAYSEHFQFRQPHEPQWNFNDDLATAIGLPLPNELMQLNRPLLTPMLASAFSIPLADFGGGGGGGGCLDGSFGGGQVGRAASDNFMANGDNPWGHSAGPCSAPQTMPQYGRDMHNAPPPSHNPYYPNGMPPQEEAQGGFMQQQGGGYPMKPPAACGPPPPMYGHHPSMPPGMPPQPHMDNGMPPMGGMPPYGGHQPGMMGYDPRGDGSMMGMPPPPHMQGGAWFPGMYDGRMHGYGGMPMDYGHGKRMMPEGGPPSASGVDWDDEQAQALKRPRLVWTPQLHKRFVDAVNQLGLKSAVPKTIMQLMNVDGLTRENVASHLQKYRLHLKRTTGTEEGEGTHGEFDGWDDAKHDDGGKGSPQEGNRAGSGSKRGGTEDEEGGGGVSEGGGGQAQGGSGQKHTASKD